MNKLQSFIEEIIFEAGGEWGIVIEDLDNEKKIAINETALFAAQSIIKLPIMAAVFSQQAQHKLRLSDMITVEREDMVKGSGILQALMPGIRLSIYDLTVLMIIQSDNTATNILLDLVGFTEVERIMKQAGMINSRLRKKLMIYPVTNETVENVITAADMNLFLRKLVRGEIVSRYSCEQMISIMKQQQVRNALPAYLPSASGNLIGQLPAWELANKTGTDTNEQHDVGILYAHGRTVAVSILSRQVEMQKALDAEAKIGREVYNYMSYKCKK